MTGERTPHADPEPPEGVDTTVPQSARIWNYWLGGKDNYPVDRQAGDLYARSFPGILDIARQSRAFLARTVRFLTFEAGIRQFLDVGTGLPTVDSVHQIAQQVAPESRVVYVDNDPLVLLHARRLLTGTPEGAIDYIDADLHDPESILRGAAHTLDLTRPVGLMLLGVMGHITDDEEAYAIVNRLMTGLASGSYLVLSDGTNEIPEEFQEAQLNYDQSGAVPYKLRDRRDVARFFQYLELMDPGLVPCLEWRPEVYPIGPRADIEPLGGVARKP